MDHSLTSGTEPDRSGAGLVEEAKEVLEPPPGPGRPPDDSPRDVAVGPVDLPAPQEHLLEGPEDLPGALEEDGLVVASRGRSPTVSPARSNLREIGS